MKFFMFGSHIFYKYNILMYYFREYGLHLIILKLIMLYFMSHFLAL